jgi:F-type H+-transporting ATPase subunit delta
MQAASRESFSAAQAALTTYARTADAGTLATTGDELLGFATVLASQARLRRALSDPARDGQQRVELARGLLAGKVSAGTADLVATLVGNRWSAPSELLEATERLGVDTVLASAEKSDDLSEVEDELFRFGQVVSGNSELAAAVGDSRTPVAPRVELARSLLVGKAKPATVRLAELAVSGFGGRQFGAGLARLVELAAQRRDAEVALVTVAEPLTDAEEQRLAASLGAIYGRTISTKVTVDPAALGGLSVQVGSDLYDGTVARRLAVARQALTGRG